MAGGGGTLRPSFHQARSPYLATLPVRSQGPASPHPPPGPSMRWEQGREEGSKKMGTAGRAAAPTLQHQGHVVVAEGAVAAVVVDELGGAPPAQLLVQAPTAPVFLGVVALLPHQHDRAPGPLARRPLAVRALTGAGHQRTPRGLHRVAWDTHWRLSHFGWARLLGRASHPVCPTAPPSGLSNIPPEASVLDSSLDYPSFQNLTL